MTSASVTSHSSDALYIDAEGKCYMVRGILGAGDCALLSLLINPIFTAPVSSSNKLRRAIVSFTRGAHREEYFTAFSLVGDRVSTHFETYLSHVLQPGVWVEPFFIFGFLWHMVVTFNLISSMSSGSQKLRALEILSRSPLTGMLIFLKSQLMFFFISTGA